MLLFEMSVCNLLSASMQGALGAQKEDTAGKARKEAYTSTAWPTDQ